MLKTRFVLAPIALFVLCCVSLPLSAATITIIDDHFDDVGGTAESRVGTNANGVGTGFNFHVNNTAATIAEGSGTSVVTLNSTSAGSLVQMFSNDTFNPSAANTTILSWTIQDTTGGFNGRRYVGLRDASLPNNDFTLPGGGFEDHGFYVTLPDRAADNYAGNGRLGNLVYVNAALVTTTLASWDWGTFTGNNALDISLTLTADSYALTLSDNSITLTDGALSGSLTHGLTDARVFAYQQGTGGTLLDQIQVTLEVPPVPEPGSFSLIGLGLLFVMRGRRRRARQS